MNEIRQSCDSFDASTITRPDPLLLRYDVIVSVLPLIWIPPLVLIISPLIFLPLYFKYRTLQYRFDDEGISMSYGLLFKKETHLTYRRIQDIHVSRNLIHRWLGLAKVDIQTASGSSTAEMSIEGIPQADQLRDFLYLKMRGVKEGLADAAPAEPRRNDADEAARILGEIRDQLRSIRSLRSEEQSS